MDYLWNIPAILCCMLSVRLRNLGRGTVRRVWLFCRLVDPAILRLFCRTRMSLQNLIFYYNLVLFSYRILIQFLWSRRYKDIRYMSVSGKVALARYSKLLMLSRVKSLPSKLLTINYYLKILKLKNVYSMKLRFYRKLVIVRILSASMS